MEASRFSFVLCAAAVVLTVAGCGTSGAPEICDATELDARLSSASPGDTIRLGECRVSGTFTVPSGVTLQGAGTGSSVLVAPAGERGVVLVPGESESVLRDMTIEASGLAGLFGTGAGSVMVERVEVLASAGTGVGFDDLDSVTLSDVSITGPLTTASRLPSKPSPTKTALYGLVLRRVMNASLSKVDVRGFAAFGVLALDSNVRWTEGSASQNRSVGLMMSGGSADLTGVEISETFAGGALLPPYSGVFSAGATVSTEELVVSNSEGHGLIHDAVAAIHADLVATDNEKSAVWVQRVDGFELSGSGTRLLRNAFGAFVGRSSVNITIADARIDETRTSEGFADGIHLVDSAVGLTLRRLTLTNNERIGVLADIRGSSSERLVVEGVTVSGVGSQLGALVQDLTGAENLPGVVRNGESAGNDDLSAGLVLEIIEADLGVSPEGAVGPDYQPGLQ